VAIWQGRPAGGALVKEPPPPPRTRALVRLEEIDDVAVRARIIRNREAAQRSNAQRRAEREARLPQT